MTASICGWCGVYATMTPVTAGQSGPIIEPGVPIFWVQAAFACNHCRKLSIGETVIEGKFTSPTTNDWAWWDAKSLDWCPKQLAGRVFQDTPKHVASAADEAYRCRSANALRSSILMARSVIEATCKDKGVTQGSLAGKIDAMTERGLIRPFTQEAAHELRFLGNDMAHGDFVDPIDNDDADAVLEVMAEILNEVYQGPARVSRMRAKRQFGGADSSGTPEASETGGEFFSDGSDH